jgi:hypothetical protein
MPLTSADLHKEVHDRLKPVASAYYDSSVSPAGCLEGTRIAIHAELADWAGDGVPTLTTLWLNGMAGTGKTAIASTFARNMEDQGILGATFFIDRQQAERRDLSRIVQTLAYALAMHNHEQLRAVWAVLRDDPTFERLLYQEQARLLIKKPLEVGRPETLVVVIDGLDECGAAEGASLLETLVTSLAHHPIKLFVTSRNEVDIVDTFRDIAHDTVKLQEIGVSGDVRLYWEHNLDELRRRKHLPDWRPMVSIERLVELTGHLFIYATTIIKIIRNTITSPIKKLRELLEVSRAGSGYAIAFVGPVNHGPLEQLYIHILGEALRDDDGKIISEYAFYLHSILEIVILAQAPITPQALSDLLDMDMDDVNAYLSRLSSVLVVPDATSPEGLIRPLHQSFPDFVRQQGDVVHPALTIRVDLAHKNFIERCLRQLNKLLHFNMCKIDDASLSNNEVPDLDNHLREYVTEALRYSCRFWVIHWLEHIRAAGAQAEIPDGLNDFCAAHLLHWIEVLSLTGDMYAIQRAMLELVSVVQVSCLPH